MQTSSLHSRKLQGTLLAASPCIADHPLPGAVYLITHHDESGVIAVCLNDQANQVFQRRCLEWAEAGLSEKLLLEFAASEGHRVDWAPWLSPYLEPNSHVTAYTSRLYTDLREAAAGLGKTVRLFVGQQHFPLSQIEDQIARGLWLSVPASPEILFSDLSDVWVLTVRKAGESTLCEITGNEQLHREFAWN